MPTKEQLRIFLSVVLIVYCFTPAIWHVPVPGAPGRPPVKSTPMADEVPHDASESQPATPQPDLGPQPTAEQLRQMNAFRDEVTFYVTLFRSRIVPLLMLIYAAITVVILLRYVASHLSKV